MQVFAYHNCLLVQCEFMYFECYFWLGLQAPGIQQEYNVPKIISLNGRSSWVKETINISLPSTALPKTKFLFITITGKSYFIFIETI